MSDYYLISAMTLKEHSFILNLLLLLVPPLYRRLAVNSEYCCAFLARRNNFSTDDIPVHSLTFLIQEFLLLPLPLFFLSFPSLQLEKLVINNSKKYLLVMRVGRHQCLSNKILPPSKGDSWTPYWKANEPAYVLYSSR